MGKLPVSGVQSEVLRPLGLSAKDWTEAAEMLEKLGLCVTAKRVGRTSVPVVTLLETVGGAFNRYGEGETWTIDYREIDLTPILPFIAERDRAAAERRIARYHESHTDATGEPATTTESLHAEIEAEHEARYQARKEREAAAREQRALTNQHLRQHGYHWSKIAGGDEEDYEWILRAPGGRIVTVAEALREINDDGSDHETTLSASGPSCSTSGQASANGSCDGTVMAR